MTIHSSQKTLAEGEDQPESGPPSGLTPAEERAILQSELEDLRAKVFFSPLSHEKARL